MSDLMLFGVLEMPYKMAMSDEISRTQFHSRAKQACDRIRALEAELAALKSQEPVVWLIPGTITQDKHLAEANGVNAKPLFLAAGAQVQAQPVQQEPAAWEHCFVDPSKKILSYTKTCAGFPPRDDAYQINPLYAQPVQAQERKEQP